MSAIPKTPSGADVLPVIYKALGELNQQRPKNQRLQASPDCVFVGENGRLNSLELANLIVLMEQLVHETFGAEIDLTEHDPFSLDNGHMRTASTLAEHISNLLREQA
ncbi:MAG TPA: hypothetical protein VMG31_07310 [Verrucomicrobiae bacterium]|nr:hypothetical protein [Verrucomicrobiae bacterium]